jgi:hypothetical protein
VAAVLFVLQLLCTFPGELISDSREQLQQALTHQYTDWHPPVMALVWSWLIGLGTGVGGLLALHQLLHWLGIGLIADGCHRTGRRSQAWLVLAAGAFPLFLFYDRMIVKDVGMASAFIAGTGMVAWFVVQERRVPGWVMALSGLCLLYGVLIRTNAVFAIGPLLLLYFVRSRWPGLAKVIAWSCVTAVMAVPLSNWVNHGLIGAKSEYSVQSLQLFDLMGIAVDSGDERVMGDKPPPMSEIRSCYTSYWWDTVSPWGSCPQLRLALGYTTDIDTTDPASIARTARLWRAAVLSHPAAYLSHRLQYFNSSLYFIVPAYHFRYSKSALLAPYGTQLITQRDIRLDYLKSNFLCWPVMWLYLGGCALALLAACTTASSALSIARLLLISGWLFAAAYFLVGVATDFRYYYWSIMATQIGIILASREIGAGLRSRWAGRLVLAGLALIVLAGYVARIADVRFV